MKHGVAVWTLGASLRSMYTALGAEALLLMKSQRVSRNFGQKVSRNWEYEETYIIEF